MKIVLFIVGLAVAVAFIPSSEAAGRARVACNNHAVQAVHHEAVYVAPVVAVPILTLSYAGNFSYLYSGGGYAPVQQAPMPAMPQQTWPQAQRDFTEAELEAILSRSVPRLNRGGAHNVLSQNCAKCHQGPSAKGGTRIFEADGSLSTRLNKAAIVRAADTAAMPPGARNDLSKALSDSDVEVLRAWAAN